MAAKLNPKQQLFCELYATNRDMFGNGVECYGEAYGLDLTIPNKYAAARTGAYRLLTNSDVLVRIQELLDLGPLSDAVVDRELAFVIAQNAELPSKVAAIREYNKLKGRITDKMEHLGKNGGPIAFLDMSSRGNNDTD